MSRRPRTIPAVTLALALPTAGALTAALGTAAVLVVPTEVHAAPAPDEEAGPPPLNGTAPPKSSPPKSSPPPPATVRPRTTTPPPPSSTPPPPDGSASADGADPISSEPELPPQDLSGNWGYSKARPTTPRYVRTDNPVYYASPNPIGFYSGVSVAGNHVPPIAPQSFDSRPALMTWTGFERAHEGSRVFFQLNNAVQFSVESAQSVITIRMRNTKPNVRNNTRALDLRYFRTPVRSVKVRKRGKDTIAKIVLKHDAEPQVQLVDGKEGYKLLVVQFADAIAPDEQRERINPTEKIQPDAKVQPLPASSGN